MKLVMHTTVAFGYNGPIFDAHTHIIGTDRVGLLDHIAESFGITKTLAIIHSQGDLISAKERYPERYVFAKYFSGAFILTSSPSEVTKEVRILQDEGYVAAKTHFAPFWIQRIEERPLVRRVDADAFDYFFNEIEELGTPLIIHISDPDTYYATRYSDVALYGTKDEHIDQFDRRLSRNNHLRFQAAHFAAQPEIHRLPQLSQMLEHHKNLFIDMSSARWMARELGKNVERSRDFFIAFADRILFATDCVTRHSDPEYYRGRYFTLRTLLETDVRGVPLPFEDSDTAATGGTFINGLDLPDNVLRRIYWENAVKLYDLEG